MTEMGVESQPQPVADISGTITTNMEMETVFEKNDNVETDMDVEIEGNKESEANKEMSTMKEVQLQHNQKLPEMEVESESKCDLQNGHEVEKETNFSIENSTGKATDINGVSEVVKPFAGFCGDEYNEMLVKIEEASSRLFNIVTKGEAIQKAAIRSAILRRKGVIPISTSYPRAYVVNVELKKIADEIAEEVKEKKKLKMLRDLLDGGWRRVMMKSSTEEDNSKISYVYYFSPEGKKFKFPKEVIKYLSFKPGTPWTLDNFSFFKKPIYPGSPRESYRTASPRNLSVPANAVEKTPKESCSEEEIEITRKDFERRRNIQPPKRYSGKGDEVGALPKRKAPGDEKLKSRKEAKVYLEMGMLPPKYPVKLASSLSLYGTVKEEPCDSPENLNNDIEDLDDSMFLISAMQESGEFVQLKQQLELEKQMKQLQETQVEEVIPIIQNITKNSDACNVAVTTKRILERCSISCQDTIDKVPRLQCQVCYCKYHPECLGLSLNLQYSNFVCSNCEDTHIGVLSAKPRKTNQPPPQLSPMPDFLKPPPSYVAADSKIMKDRNPTTGLFENWSRQLQNDKLPFPVPPAFSRRAHGHLPPLPIHGYCPPGNEYLRNMSPLPVGSSTNSKTLWFEPPGRGMIPVRSRANQYHKPSLASSLMNVGMRELISLFSDKRPTVQPVSPFPKNIVLPPVPELKPISGIKPFRSSPYQPIKNPLPRSNPRVSKQRLVMRKSIQSLPYLPDKRKMVQPKPFPYRENGTPINCGNRMMPPVSNGLVMKRFPQSVVTVDGKKFLLMPAGPLSPGIALVKEELIIEQTTVV